MSIQHILADLHNARTLLEAEQERRQHAEAEVDRLRAELADQKALFESCNRARKLEVEEVDRLRAQKDTLERRVSEFDTLQRI